MAKRRRLEAPGPAELADLEAGFAAKPLPDRSGLAAPIAQVAGDIARAAEPLDLEKRVSIARDSVDAEAWRKAQDEGRVIQDLGLDVIDEHYLMRDRLIVEAEELDELKASIRMNGLRLPVEVVEIAPGRFGLVSGWRRMKVMRDLLVEDGPAFATIKAIVRPPYEAQAIYTAMVEENELRAQITPYERGRIAVMAAKFGPFPDTDAAIETIFATASRAKRSKIRSFALVHDELGDVLKFPTDLSERNGLRLAHAIREGHGTELRAALPIAGSASPALEWSRLEPVVAAAEAIERQPERGGRPRKTLVRPLGDAQAQASGITMERVQHEDGYSIRLRGKGIDAAMVDRLMDDLHRLLRPLPASDRA